MRIMLDKVLGKDLSKRLQIKKRGIAYGDAPLK